MIFQVFDSLPSPGSLSDALADKLRMSRTSLAEVIMMKKMIMKKIMMMMKKMKMIGLLLLSNNSTLPLILLPLLPLLFLLTI